MTFCNVAHGHEITRCYTMSPCHRVTVSPCLRVPVSPCPRVPPSRHHSLIPLPRPHHDPGKDARLQLEAAADRVLFAAGRM